MKKFISLVLLLQTALFAFAQNATYLWPIKSVENGQNILFKPNEYIEKEHNFDNLFITASKGTEILAPTDGTVTMYNPHFLSSLVYSSSFGGFSNGNFDDFLKTLVEKGTISKKEAQFVSMSIGLRTTDGKTIYISGLYPVKGFKTGEKVRKGDVIGTMGYSYKAIKQPSICLSISEKALPADPMTPFGLKTTFKKPEPRKELTVLSPEQAKQDFQALVDALKEAHTGLYDYMSEQEFEAYVAQTLRTLNSSIAIFDFEKLLHETLCKLRDSHTGIVSQLHFNTSSMYRGPGSYYPTVDFGWLNTDLVVTRVIGSDRSYYGKKILEVDGFSADSLKQMILPYLNLSEGFIESRSDFHLLTAAAVTYFLYTPNASKQGDLTLKFEDGTTQLFKGYKHTGQSMGFYPHRDSLIKFRYINQHENIDLKKLSDTVAYLGLSTFGLTEVETDQVVDFIKSISNSGYQHLIIDVRNNAGGHEEVCTRIFSCIAKYPFQTSEFSRVNKRGKFSSFKNCMNYAPDMDLFTEFTSIKGKNGFYLMNDKQIFPDTAVNFKGKVYILTNENSFSASALLAGLIYQQKRGAVVGREAGTTYYQMNAMKFADLRLPNSYVDIRIPLWKTVFTSQTDEHIPWGRGVLPDFPVPFTLDEIAYENGDAILNHALQLINDGVYIEDIEYIDDVENISIYNILGIILSVLIICGAMFVFYQRKRGR
ncbi:MAG: S41 family peptidase [Bacteroidales bacterium]|jgi:hypothetical protein|nr:S41 family peptidase [Bacteroidales bacterium]